eukprot:gene29261-36281_t
MIASSALGRQSGQPIQPRKSATWTEEMDERLRHAADQFGLKWGAVAQFLNEGKTSEQCYNRWTRYANPALEKCKKTKWTDDEVSLLKDLVRLHVKQDKNGTPIVLWATVSDILNRTEMDCHNKYRNLLGDGTKKGHFSLEEDQFIQQRVHENEGRDMTQFWRDLAKEMNRVHFAVQKRWLKIEKSVRDHKFKKQLFWTEEMDARLVEAHTQFGPNWKACSDFVNDERVTPDAVRRRWKCRADPSLSQAEKADQEWTPEEIVRLFELIPQRQKTQMCRLTTDWDTIGKELGRSWIECKRKEKAVRIAQMKHGRFTPLEDATIRQRAQEWYGK